MSIDKMNSKQFDPRTTTKHLDCSQQVLKTEDILYPAPHEITDKWVENAIAREEALARIYDKNQTSIEESSENKKLKLNSQETLKDSPNVLGIKDDEGKPDLLNNYYLGYMILMNYKSNECYNEYELIQQLQNADAFNDKNFILGTFFYMFDKLWRKALVLNIDLWGELHKCFMFGAHKYGKFNYRKGFNFSRLIKAYLRHDFLGDTNYDLDSGLLHIVHKAANILILAEIIYLGTGINDLGHEV